jgi:hypothetical protein
MNTLCTEGERERERERAIWTDANERLKRSMFRFAAPPIARLPVRLFRAPSPVQMVG